jgi:hypothetical protein
MLYPPDSPKIAHDSQSFSNRGWNWFNNRDVYPRLTDTSDKTPGVPYVCGMSAHKNCPSFLSIWTVGQAGKYLHNTGLRLGQHGFKRMAFHVNLKTNYIE